MQTIHIDSLDELPHAAAAVINALEGRSVVVFRGEMGAGKTTLIREIVARLGADDKSHFRHRQSIYDPRREEYLSLRFLPDQPARRGLRLRLRGIFLLRGSLSGRMAREDRRAAARRGDDRADRRRRRRRAHDRNRLTPDSAQYPCIVLLNTDFPPSGSSRRDHPAHGCNRECVIQPGSNDRLPKRISGVVSFPTPQRETERSREPAGQIRLATLYHPCSK